MLTDIIEPGLRVVFCGTAVGSKSAEAGAYYAGPGNAFWRTLYEVGLTPRELKPAEAQQLLSSGIGLTDLCKIGSGPDREIGTRGFDRLRFVSLLVENTPDWIAFNGKKAAQAALGRPTGYGDQGERLGPSRAFVLPSTSGAARGYWDIR